jgi:hypothetical protein
MRWAEKMRDRMGPRAVLVRYTGEGHGQVLRADCVNEAAASTLVALELPADNTVCQPDGTVGEPSWWANVPRAEPNERFVDRDQVETLIGITKKESYATGLMMVGTTDELMVQIHQRLELLGFMRVEEIQTFDDGIKYADYVVDGGAIRLLVIGSDLIRSSEWEHLKSSVPESQGIVVFLAFQ